MRAQCARCLEAGSTRGGANFAVRNNSASRFGGKCGIRSCGGSCRTLDSLISACDSEFFFELLFLIKACVVAVECEQFFMATGLDDSAMIQDSDLVRISHC